MRKNQLYIKVNDEWKELDLFEDVDIPTTFEIDTLKLGQRATGYSIDFQLPATEKNTITFGLVHDVDVYRSSFEIEKNYEAILTDNALTVFKGQFRLKKITIKHNKQITYTGNLFGGVKNLLDALGNDTLTGNEDSDKDLDFSEYNVPASEMQLSDFRDYLQTHYTDATGWGLTLLDKTNKYSQAFSSGVQQWYTDETTPYLYDREIFDKIIHQAGWQYESEFLNGTDFSTYIHDPRWEDTIGQFDVNSLIYPYMRHNSNIHISTPVSSIITQNDPTTSAVIANYQYYKESSLGEANMITTSIALNQNDFTLTEQNVTSDINAYQFTATQNGYYTIDWNFNVEGRIQLRNVSNEAPAGFSTINTQGEKPYTVWVQLQKNNTLIGNRVRETGTVTGNYTTYIEYDSSSQRNEYYVTLATGSFSYQNTGVWLNAGDTLKLYMWIQCPVQYEVYNRNTELWETHWVWHHYSNLGVEYYTNFYPKYLQIKLTNSANPIISNVINDGFYEGNEFHPNEVLNEKTTKIDFINNFIKSFNLYIEDVSGKMNYKTGKLYPDNTLRIEPWEIFYHPEVNYGSNVHDWTNKVDWETVEYQRVSDFLYTNQIFTKAQDDDFFNEDYNKTFKTPHENRVVKSVYASTEENEIPVAVSANLCGVVNNQTDALQCPKVFSKDKDNNVDKKKEFSDGMFFIWRNNTAASTSQPSNYTLKLQSRLSASSINMTDYYTADYLNKGYGAETASLLFGPVENYYQNLKGSQMTSNDLYNAFYKKQFEEMTDQDARIMDANIYLNAMDIATLQMSDTIIVDSNYWRVLNIDQWTSEDNPCKVKLLKVFE